MGASAKCREEELVSKCPSAYPGWFLAKSSETIENKRVEFLPRAKEFASI
jgi:hypothetical protein